MRQSGVVHPLARPRARHAVAALLATGVLAISGCGGDDGGSVRNLTDETVNSDFPSGGGTGSGATTGSTAGSITPSDAGTGTPSPEPSASPSSGSGSPSS